MSKKRIIIFAIILISLVYLMLHFLVESLFQQEQVIYYNETNRYSNYGIKSVYCDGITYFTGEYQDKYGLYKYTDKEIEFLFEPKEVIWTLSCSEDMIIYQDINNWLYRYDIDENEYELVLTYPDPLRLPPIIGEGHIYIFKNERLENLKLLDYSQKEYVDAMYIDVPMEGIYSLKIYSDDNIIHMITYRGTHPVAESFYDKRSNSILTSTYSSNLLTNELNIISIQDNNLYFNYENNVYILDLEIYTVLPVSNFDYIDFSQTVHMFVLNGKNYMTYKNLDMVGQNTLNFLLYEISNDSSILLYKGVNEHDIPLTLDGEDVIVLKPDGLYKVNSNSSTLIKTLDLEDYNYVEVKGDLLLIYTHDHNLHPTVVNEILYIIDLTELD